MTTATFKLSKDEIELIEQQDDATLAQWWCDLNRSRWPDGIPNPEPFHEPLRLVSDTRAWALMCRIIEELGMRVAIKRWREIFNITEHTHAP